jgi:hypothetical protein
MNRELILRGALSRPAGGGLAWERREPEAREGNGEAGATDRDTGGYPAPLKVAQSR